MAKKKKEDPEKAENHERWLLTYADLITLLMIFFVVLYSMSSVDAAKFNALSNSLSVAFPGGDGVLMYTSAIPDQIPIPSEEPANVSEDGSGGENKDKSDIEELKKSVETVIKDNNLQTSVGLQVSERGLVITLSDIMFFESGKAEIPAASQQSLIQIGQSLNKIENYIRIEGSTDNIPMRSINYASNWELSTARAISVLRLFIDQAGVNPSKLAAVGYGEYRPIATNATPQGRAKNRRVDIIILDTKFSQSESGGTAPNTQNAVPPVTQKP